MRRTPSSALQPKAPTTGPLRFIPATIPSGLRQDLLKTLRKFVEDNIEE